MGTPCGYPAGHQCSPGCCSGSPPAPPGRWPTSSCSARGGRSGRCRGSSGCRWSGSSWPSSSRRRSGARPPALTAADGAWIAIGGVSGLLGYACIFYAFEHGRLTLAVPIMSSWAVLSSALSLIVFHEQLTAGQLLGSATVIAGAVVVGRNAQTAGAAGGAQLEALAAGLHRRGGRIRGSRSRPCAGFRRCSARWGRSGSCTWPIWRSRCHCCSAFASALPPPRGRAWWPIVWAGFLETAGSVCITLGVRRAPVAIVSPFASLAAAFTVVYAWAILRSGRPEGP